MKGTNNIRVWSCETGGDNGNEMQRRGVAMKMMTRATLESCDRDVSELGCGANNIFKNRVVNIDFSIKTDVNKVIFTLTSVFFIKKPMLTYNLPTSIFLKKKTDVKEVMLTLTLIF